MAENEFTRCDCCQKSFTGPEPFVEHLHSKAHQKKSLESVKRNPYGIKDAEPSDPQYYCSECGISLSGPEPYKQHVNGSKHQSHVAKKKIMTSIKSSELEEASSKHIEITEDVLACKVCNKCFSGPESLAQHLNSKKHSRKIQLADLSQRINDGAEPTCPGMVPPTNGKFTPGVPALTRGEYIKSGAAHKKPQGCFSAIKSIFKNSDKKSIKPKIKKNKKK